MGKTVNGKNSEWGKGMSGMTKQKIDHASFTVTRDFKAEPARIYRAHLDKAAKQRWFTAGEGFETFKYEIDARVGGHEVWRGAYQGGPKITNDTHYLDLVENERIILAYEMTIGGNRISASLLTIVIEPKGSGSRLTLTEQGVYLADGDAGVTGRETGTRELLEALAKEVDA
jgi:uncharacterized protein YndB with AHSA1/START domain